MTCGLVSYSQRALPPHKLFQNALQYYLLELSSFFVCFVLLISKSGIYFSVWFEITLLFSLRIFSDSNNSNQIINTFPPPHWNTIFILWQIFLYSWANLPHLSFPVPCHNVLITIVSQVIFIPGTSYPFFFISLFSWQFSICLFF